MAVDEGKWFSKMLASRKTFAEYTKLNKRPLYPVILSKILCKSASISRLCGMENMLNEPNLVLSEVEWIKPNHLLINSIMSNEPNFDQRTSSIKYPESRIDQKMSNEPNLPGGQVAHLINEKRTKNHKQLSNEPNLCQKTIFFSLRQCRRLLSTHHCGGCLIPYCGGHYKKMQNEPNYHPINHFINEQLSNEPNFKNRQMNVNSLSKIGYVNFYSLDRRKNEPNLSHDRSIVACLPRIALAKEGRQRRWNPNFFRPILLNRYNQLGLTCGEPVKELLNNHLKNVFINPMKSKKTTNHTFFQAYQILFIFKPFIERKIL